HCSLTSTATTISSRSSRTNRSQLAMGLRRIRRSLEQTGRVTISSMPLRMTGRASLPQREHYDERRGPGKPHISALPKRRARVAARAATRKGAPRVCAICMRNHFDSKIRSAVCYQACNLHDYRLPFEDETFDVVVMCEVLEHLNFNPLPVRDQPGHETPRGCLCSPSQPGAGGKPPEAVERRVVPELCGCGVSDLN